MNESKLATVTITVYVPADTADATTGETLCEEICDRLDQLAENSAAVLSTEFPIVRAVVS